jgi:hypothetical protein
MMSIYDSPVPMPWKVSTCHRSILSAWFFVWLVFFLVDVFACMCVHEY